MRFAASALVLLLAGCAHGFVADRLYCGLSIPDGGSVSQAELDAFVREVVEPRFPRGFTVWRARGHWEGGGEEVFVLEVFRPRDEQSARAVAAIAEEYRRRFRQQAVLRVTAPVRMELAR